MLDAADAGNARHAVALGRVVAHYATMRQMSLGVAGMLARGDNPALAAALVKDQGALIEQAMPDLAHELFGGTVARRLVARTRDALHDAGCAVVLAARRHSRDPARHHRQEDWTCDEGQGRLMDDSLIEQAERAAACLLKKSTKACATAPSGGALRRAARGASPSTAVSR